MVVWTSSLKRSIWICSQRSVWLFARENWFLLIELWFLTPQNSFRNQLLILNTSELRSQLFLKSTLEPSGIRIKKSSLLGIDSFFFFLPKTSESRNRFCLDLTWFLMPQNQAISYFLNWLRKRQRNQGVNSFWNRLFICKASELRN